MSRDARRERVMRLTDDATSAATRPGCFCFIRVDVDA
jgi:hypothetical protein